MTDEDRKFLVEEIGECWHEIGYQNVCPKCHHQVLPNIHRTFDNWTDFGAVKEKLWTPKFQEWIERELSWQEWEKKSPEQRCSFYLNYCRRLA